MEATLSVIGGVWKPVLLFHLLGGTLRFNALCRLTPSATQRMITLQLRELEADGIVRRTVYPEVPPKVEYDLTPLGRTLEPVLVAMREWGASFQGDADVRVPPRVRAASPDRGCGPSAVGAGHAGRGAVGSSVRVRLGSC